MWKNEEGKESTEQTLPSEEILLTFVWQSVFFLLLLLYAGVYKQLCVIV